MSPVVSLLELVVEDAFVARGPGIVVEPRIVARAALQEGPLRALLVRPDGTRLETRATLDVAHLRGALDPYALVRLPDLALADVPAGTTIALCRA